MFIRNKIAGVSGNRIVAAQGAPAMGNTPSNGVAHVTKRRMSSPTEVNANLTFMGGGTSMPSAMMSVNGFWNSQYQYYMTGLLPADPSLPDSSSLALFYRDIYLYDNVAGSAVDIQSTFPFSEYDLRGVEDSKLHVYADTLNQLNIPQMLPEISVAYLVDGFFAGTLVFDPKTRQFRDTLIHDALQCSIMPSPFYNVMPRINVRVGQATQQFIDSGSPYAERYLRTLPPAFLNLLHEGAFELSPETTLFIGRKSLTDRAYVSFLHRVLPMYLIEKTMFRGTLVEAARRQRAMTHITAGDDLWTPTSEELLAYVGQFQTAEFDPLGGWVSTRNAVQVTDIRPGGDFWKWTDMADIMVPYKLRALGISESFLSGDASYAAAESAYSTFLESMNAYRQRLTNTIFYSTLFPLIAVANGFYKKDAKTHVRNGDIMGFLSNNANRASLDMPDLMWHKNLEAKGEENTFEMLEKLSERGVPIPMKSWIAAAGQDAESLIKDLKDDTELRKRLEEHTGKDTSHEGEEGFNPDGDNGDDIYAALRAGRQTSQSMVRGNARTRRSILGRDWGESGEMFVMSRSGKVKHYVYNQRQKDKEANIRIAKIHAAAQKDKNYRAELARRNKEKLGTTTAPLANELRSK